MDTISELLFQAPVRSLELSQSRIRPPKVVTPRIYQKKVRKNKGNKSEGISSLERAKPTLYY